MPSVETVVTKEPCFAQVALMHGGCLSSHLETLERGERWQCADKWLRDKADWFGLLDGETQSTRCCSVWDTNTNINQQARQSELTWSESKVKWKEKSNFQPYLSAEVLKGTAVFKEFPKPGLTIIIKEGMNLNLGGLISDIRSWKLQCLSFTGNLPRVRSSVLVMVGPERKRLARGSTSWNFLDQGSAPNWMEFLHIPHYEHLDSEHSWANICSQGADVHVLLSVELEHFAGRRYVIGSVEMLLEADKPGESNLILSCMYSIPAKPALDASFDILLCRQGGVIVVCSTVHGLDTAKCSGEMP